MATLQVDRTLACEGLACPLPVVRTKKTIDEMKAGEVLEVRATDKGSVADLKGWASRTGHQYIGLKEENGVFLHYIRKAEPSETKAETAFPHTISHEDLWAKVAEGDRLRILDVREPAEYAFGHIPGAVSIPLGELEERLAELDPSREYVLICRTGHRSDLACRLLADKGFKSVRNALPGMSQWTEEVEQNQ